jgi:lysophospholipase L1-like esterase
MGFVRTSSSGGYTAKGIVDDTDFSEFDSVYICLGYNDYHYDKTLGTPTDSAGDATVCGQLKYVIETIYASNPAIKIFVKKMGGSGGANSASIPYTQAELQTALEATCDVYGVEMFVGGRIANAYNISMIFPDGVHPTAAVMAQMAKDMTGRVTFK